MKIPDNSYLVCCVNSSRYNGGDSLVFQNHLNTKALFQPASATSSSVFTFAGDGN